MGSTEKKMADQVSAISASQNEFTNPETQVNTGAQASKATTFVGDTPTTAHEAINTVLDPSADDLALSASKITNTRTQVTTGAQAPDTSSVGETTTTTTTQEGTNVALPASANLLSLFAGTKGQPMASLFGSGFVGAADTSLPATGPDAVGMPALSKITVIPYVRDTSTRFRLNLEHFCDLNPNLFQRFKTMRLSTTAIFQPDLPTVNLFVDRKRIIVHHDVLHHSHQLHAAFSLPMAEGKTGELVVMEGNIHPWLIVLLAMYGAEHVPRGAWPAVGEEFVHALEIADYRMVDEITMAKIVTMLKGHFKKYGTWKSHGRYHTNGYTFIADGSGVPGSGQYYKEADGPVTELGDEHNRLLISELNSAYIAYKKAKMAQKPFGDMCFAVLLWKTCGPDVYKKYQDLLDNGLVRLVAKHMMGPLRTGGIVDERDYALVDVDEL